MGPNPLTMTTHEGQRDGSGSHVVAELRGGARCCRMGGPQRAPSPCFLAGPQTATEAVGLCMSQLVNREGCACCCAQGPGSFSFVCCPGHQFQPQRGLLTPTEGPPSWVWS